MWSQDNPYEIKARKLRSLQTWRMINATGRMLKKTVAQPKITYDELQDTKAEIYDLRKFRRSGFFGELNKRYLRHQDDIYSDHSISQNENGIIYFSTLKYRIGWDPKRKLAPLFWARRTDDFSPTIDRDDVDRLNPYRNIYLADVLSGVLSRVKIRDALIAHHRIIRRFGIKKMSLVGGNLSDIYKKSTRRKVENPNNEIVGYTNKAFAVSVHGPKRAGEGWVVKLSRPWGDNPQQTEIDNFDPKKNITKGFISNGKVYGRYTSRAEALATMEMFLSHRTQMIWGAEDPASMVGFKIKNRLMGAFSDVTTNSFTFLSKQPTDSQNKFEMLWDALFIPALLVGARVVSPPVAIGIFLLKSFTVRKVKEFVQGKIGTAMFYARGPAGVLDQDLAPYVAAFPENMHRKPNRKPNVSEFQNIHLLSKSDIDIPHSRSKERSYEVSDKVAREICAHDSKAFSRRVSMIDENMSTERCDNGLVRLARVKRKEGWVKRLLPQLASQDVDFYAKYVPELDTNEKIPLSEDAKEFLSDGKIVRYSERKGTDDIAVKILTYAEMEEEVMTHACLEKKAGQKTAQKFARGHINWLFNNKASRYQTYANTNHESPPLRLTASMRADKPKEIVTQVTAKERFEALTHIFGSRIPHIEAPTESQIDFQEGAMHPMQSYVITSSNQQIPQAA